MKNVGAELYAIVEQKELVKKDIAEAAGITPVYLSQIMNKTSIDCELLERICRAMEVNPSYFFDYTEGDTPVSSADNNVATAKIAGLQNEIKLLKDLLSEKERIIKILFAERERSSGQ